MNADLSRNCIVTKVNVKSKYQSLPDGLLSTSIIVLALLPTIEDIDKDVSISTSFSFKIPLDSNKCFSELVCRSVIESTETWPFPYSKL